MPQSKSRGPGLAGPASPPKDASETPPRARSSAQWIVPGAQDADANLSLRTRIGHAVRAMILSGELQPGQRLLQQQLARRFGVSQSVLRESLLEAEFTGLVESVDRMGAFVAAIDQTQLMDAYEIREMLEGLATRRCCERASPADLRELSEMAEKVHAFGLSGRNEDRAKLDRRFHERIIQISGSRVVGRLSEGYHIVRLVVLVHVPHDQILADHRRIIGAIQANDPEQAEKAARQHVASAREMILRQLQNAPGLFPWESRR